MHTCMHVHAYVYAYVRMYVRVFVQINHLPQNYRDAADLQLLDASLFQSILEHLQEANTFLFLVGDHGICHGAYARHSMGGEDAANPAAFLLVPIHSGALTMHELQALVRNQNRLVTPYDMYATIRAMLKRRTSSCENGNRRPYVFVVTLNKHEVAANRTCESAEIPAPFCPHWNRLKSLNTTPCRVEPSSTASFHELALNRSIELMNAKIDRLHAHQPGRPNCQRFRPRDFVVDFMNCDATHKATEPSSDFEYNIELHFTSQNEAHQDPQGEDLSYRAVMRTHELQQLSDLSTVRLDHNFKVRRTSLNSADCPAVLFHSTVSQPGNDTDAEDRLELKDICSCFGLSNFLPGRTHHSCEGACGFVRSRIGC